MAETKGIVIEFKGDSVEFDKSLDGVNKGLKTLKNEMSQINKQLKLDPSNVDLLRKKFSNLKEQQKVVKEQVALYKQEIQKLGQADIGSKKWVELQKKLGDAETELKKINKDVEEMGRMNTQLISMGTNLEKSGKEAEKLGNQLKGLSALGIAVAGALAKITIDAGQQADEINTLAKQYNLTTDEIQKFQLASDLIDVDLSTITKSYAKLTKNMTSTSKDVQNAFKELGVEVKDSNGDLRSSNDVFNELISALGKVENETLQDNLAMQIFGKSANELGTLINGGSEQLAEFSKYLEENNLILSGEELDSLNAMNDVFDTIKSTLQAFARKIAADYAPYIRKAFEKVRDVILKLRSAWDKLSPQIKKLIPVIAGLVGVLAPLIIAFGTAKEKLGNLMKLLGNGNTGLGKVFSFLKSPIGILISLFATLYATNDKFRESINNLVNSIKEKLQPIFEKVGTKLSELFAKISEKIAPFIEKAVNWFIEKVLPIVEKLVDTILPIAEAVLDAIFDVINWLVDALGDLWDYLEDVGVIDALTSAFNWLANAVSTLVDWVKDAFDWFGKLINRIKDYLAESTKVGVNAGQGGFYNGTWLPPMVNYYDSNGYNDRGGGGGKFESSGFTMNSTININTNRAITKKDVMSWADIMTDRINNNLGRLM